MEKVKKAILVKEVAEIHGKKLKHINEAINNNRIRFKDDIDIIELKSADLVDRDFLNSLGFSNSSIANANNIYLLSERGYSKLLKILDDDVAWEQYEKLVDDYFNMRKELEITREDKLCLGIIKASSQEKRMIAVGELLDFKNNQIQEKDNVIKEQSPFVELAKKRIDRTGTVSMTDMTKTYNLKRGMISTWAKDKGYIHKTIQEVNNSGEEYFKVVETNGFKGIGILEKGITLIDENIEEIHTYPTSYKTLQKRLDNKAV